MEQNKSPKKSKQDKVSKIILGTIIVLIICAIGFGVYQSMDNNSNIINGTTNQTTVLSTNKQTTTQISTTQKATNKTEPTTQKATHKTESTTQQAKTTTKQKKTTTKSYNNNDTYNAYLHKLTATEATKYCLFDIDNDGTKELIISIDKDIATIYKIYTYNTNNGLQFIDDISDGVTLFKSDDNKLKSIKCSQGGYWFFLYSIENGNLKTTNYDQGYTEGDYPAIDVESLLKFTPINDLSVLKKAYS